MSRSPACWRVLAAAAISTVAVSIGSLASPTSASAASKPTIKHAARKCKVTPNLADHGRTLSFDTEGEEDTSGDSVVDVACVLLFLKAPSYVITQIDNTRALDGMQRARWGPFRASWTYHPDNGLNIVIYVPR
jgi:hypothetical protein